MKFDIIEASPLAKGVTDKATSRTIDPIYPFDQLEVGQSFTVPLDFDKWKSLRTMTYQKSRKNKRFIFLKHDNESNKCYEISRVE
jgi:hypothetical protein